jgi:hypothetical protein
LGARHVRADIAAVQEVAVFHDLHLWSPALACLKFAIFTPLLRAKLNRAMMKMISIREISIQYAFQ